MDFSHFFKTIKKVSKKSENEQKKVSFSAPPQNKKIGVTLNI